MKKKSKKKTNAGKLLLKPKPRKGQPEKNGVNDEIMCLFSVRFIFIGGGKRLFAEYQVIADETKCQRDRGLDRDQPKDRYAVFI